MIYYYLDYLLAVGPRPPAAADPPPDPGLRPHSDAVGRAPVGGRRFALGRAAAKLPLPGGGQKAKPQLRPPEPKAGFRERA